MANMKINTATLALMTLALGATTGYAQEDDILSKYRAQGGMLPVEAGSPPASPVGDKSGSPTGGPDRAMTDFLATGKEMSQEKIEGFNEAVDQAFPMTPEMIRRYRQIHEENERAAQERPAPDEEITTSLISLEPGAPADRFSVDRLGDRLL